MDKCSCRFLYDPLNRLFDTASRERAELHITFLYKQTDLGFTDFNE
jgi:hypothetical protein